MATNPMFDDTPASALDYRLCKLPGSRLRVRGPLPRVEDPFVAVLGGTETFGKYVVSPFPDRLADWIGMPVANLSAPQAGLSLFSEEQILLDFASKADVTVLQVLPAQNMSNRLFSVHARHNDRFVGVSSALQDLFPSVDFTEIHYTGHLMSTLARTSAEAFSVVVDELKWAWTQRMRRILSLIEGDVVLLWVSSPSDGDGRDALEELEPVFIDRPMIEALPDRISDMVEVAIDGSGSLDGKIFPDPEREAARHLPGPAAHQQIADALAPAISALLKRPGRALRASRSEGQSFSISSGTAVNRSATRP